MANPYQQGNIKSAPAKENAKADLRAGETIADVARKYNISERTVWRYSNEIADEQNRKVEEGINMANANKENMDKNELPIDPSSDGTTPPQPTPPGGSAAMQFSEAGLTISVIIPPVVLTLFDFAKGAKLEPDEIDLDSWLFKCVQNMFERKYKLQLALIPVKEAEE
jgi:hypothetical protein